MLLPSRCRFAHPEIIKEILLKLVRDQRTLESGGTFLGVDHLLQTVD